MPEQKPKKIKTDLLARTLLSLRDESECERLLVDLCTVHEIQALTQRLEVAMMLRQHTTYQEITARTGASTATISRVNRCLTYGEDGYNMVLDRLEEGGR